MTTRPSNRSIMPDYAREVERFNYSERTNSIAVALLRVLLAVTAVFAWLCVIWACLPEAGK